MRSEIVKALIQARAIVIEGTTDRCNLQIALTPPIFSKSGQGHTATRAIILFTGVVLMRYSHLLQSCMPSDRDVILIRALRRTMDKSYT